MRAKLVDLVAVVVVSLLFILVVGLLALGVVFVWKAVFSL